MSIQVLLDEYMTTDRRSDPRQWVANLRISGIIWQLLEILLTTALPTKKQEFGIE